MYTADVIVASPLALATRLAEDSDTDYLSSVEVVVLLRGDMLAMQNWQHVETVFESLNKLPKQQHGVDIMRVREW